MIGQQQKGLVASLKGQSDEHEEKDYMIHRLSMGRTQIIKDPKSKYKNVRYRCNKLHPNTLLLASARVYIDYSCLVSIYMYVCLYMHVWGWGWGH